MEFARLNGILPPKIEVGEPQEEQSRRGGYRGSGHNSGWGRGCPQIRGGGRGQALKPPSMTAKDS